MNIKSLFKGERGTHKGKIKVTRDGKTFTQIRSLGRKESPRTGTGKLTKFPESIKKEILEQRSYGESGAKIKGIVENMIDTFSEKDRSKMEGLNLINEKGKLTVTSQALTDWAKKQGVESTKKRTSAVDKERESHESTKKDLKQADKKIAQLEVQTEHLKQDNRLISESKQKSDVIRGELGRDNKTLRDKLKSCLGEK